MTLFYTSIVPEIGQGSFAMFVLLTFESVHGQKLLHRFAGEQ